MIDPVQAGVRQARHQVARVAVVQAHVRQAPLVDVAQAPADAVQEGLGADDQHVRMPAGLGGHVLAAAEADLQPDLAPRRASGPPGRSGPPGIGQAIGGSRVSISAACRGLIGRDFRRPKERSGAVGGVDRSEAMARRLSVRARCDQASAFSWSTRSVFSQEKPPSLSGCAAEVAVGGGAGVDRPVQAQVLADGARRGAADQLRQGGFQLGRVDLAGAVQVDVEAERLGHADRVADLDGALVGQAGGDDVLGQVAAGVGGRAVDLGRVLAGEGAAAVRGRAAVGVDDDLAAGQAGVAVRARRSRSCRSG